MISGKYMKGITVIFLFIAIIVCGLMVYAANVFDTDSAPEYQEKLFGDDILAIDIQVNDDDWQGLLDNAQAKEWVSADLLINGELFTAVGVRTKGNSSLSQGMSSDSGRYSLQIKFNEYVKGQTCYGLDTMCINNMMGDATYMKDYLAYDIMEYVGVETPLTNYASVTVNGQDYGFCIALERYDKSFLDRAYDTSGGQLYNVKIQMGMRGDFEDMWEGSPGQPPEGMKQAAAENESDGTEASGNNTDAGNVPDTQTEDGNNTGFAGRMEGGFGGGFGGSQSGGGSLVYTDDEISSYSSIFDNAVFGSNSDKDKERVITAIKNLNSSTQLEKYYDVDEILRYFAAHTVVVNLDSYVSNMQQNYYIYERDGKITILPWDYGLSWGGYQSGEASDTVNFPVDTPVSGVNMEDRPLLDKLLEVDEYKEKYHAYLNEIVEGYFESGLFEETINSLNDKIGDYVKNDSSAYFTYEQYTEALSELITLGHLRAESISGQLDGTIPSTSDGQKADSSALVDASDVNLDALGSMMGGRGGMGQGGGRQGVPADNQENDSQSRGFGFPGGDFDLDMETMQQVMQILGEAGGELTGETISVLTELGLTEEQIDMFSGMQNQGGNNMRGMGDMQGGMPGMNGSSTQTATPSGINTEYAITIAVLLLLLAGASIFIARPRRNMI